MSPTFGCKNKGMGKSEFVAKTPILFQEIEIWVWHKLKNYTLKKSRIKYNAVKNKTQLILID